MENSIKKERKAVVYTRVSTKQQADGSNPCALQKQQCEKYAAECSMDITGYFGEFCPSSGNEADRIRRKKTVEVYKIQEHSIHLKSTSWTSH